MCRPHLSSRVQKVVRQSLEPRRYATHIEHPQEQYLFCIPVTSQVYLDYANVYIYVRIKQKNSRPHVLSRMKSLKNGLVSLSLDRIDFKGSISAKVKAAC